MFPHNDFDALVAGLQPLVTATAWAEEEIRAAIRRDPGHAERLNGSFVLLQPSLQVARREVLFRSHCPELLDRVVAGADTRPATAAECCAVLTEISLRVPLHAAAAGLYARLWQQAGLPGQPLGDRQPHLEAIHGSRIDEDETWLRSKLHRPQRQLL